MRSILASWNFILYFLTFQISLVKTPRQAILLMNKSLELNSAVGKIMGKKTSWLFSFSGFVILECFFVFSNSMKLLHPKKHYNLVCSPVSNHIFPHQVESRNLLLQENPWKVSRQCGSNNFCYSKALQPCCGEHYIGKHPEKSCP